MKLSMFLACLFFCLVCFSLSKKLSVDSSNVLEEAQFAVEELSKLSDSGVYTSLSLKKIMSAEATDGVYHKNLLLTLELTSPYFKSGKKSEIFDMIVMTHNEDGVRTLAIDEFPVMQESAIEEFWIKKVEKKRFDREKAFRRLEVEAILKGDLGDDLDVGELLGGLDVHPQISQKRIEYVQDILPRLPSEFQKEELVLSKKSLSELYDISLDLGDFSDFQRQRAQQTIDYVLKEFHRLHTMESN